MTLKVFLQIIMALHLSKDESVNAHLCSAIRENVNFVSMIRQCEISKDDFSCYGLYKEKCEQFTGGIDGIVGGYYDKGH